VAEPEITRRFNVRVPLRDGSTLSADLALPATRPAPAVVSRTPYGRSGDVQSARMAVSPGRVRLRQRGRRGRGDSDGVFDPYRNDGPDGADVIAWAAAQDWCTGDVASYGASYGAGSSG